MELLIQGSWSTAVSGLVVCMHVQERTFLLVTQNKNNTEFGALL